jgi:drug/metabolite transporter (DMT)-like permease
VTLTPRRIRIEFHPIDAALLLMTVIWGSNFTIVKVALRDIPQLPFNALRLVIASAAFVILLAARREIVPLVAAEWRRVVLLALVGHVLYQILFLGGLSRTTVANNSLIFALTPITIAVLTAAAGHEHVPVNRWVGAVISLFGIYLVVGGRAQAGATALGNVLSACAMVCWALYSVGAHPLLARRSALLVTGYTMSIGALLYLLFALPALVALEWSAIRPGAWLALLASALLALFLAYMIWYAAVQKIGNARTSAYSNVTPLVAMAVAALWLGEPITLRKLAGAAAVIAGLAITRVGRGS